MTADPNAEAIRGISDNYCAQRDPKRTAAAIASVMSECARRLCDGYMLHCPSPECDICWIIGDKPASREELVACAAAVIEQIAIWDFYNEPDNKPETKE